jgi:hypothetical protein
MSKDKFRHIGEIGPKIEKKLATGPALPCGTIGFELRSDDLFAADAKGGKILAFANGAQTFRLEREAQPKLAFYHWSPGAGSRRAIVDLADIGKNPIVQVMFSWSPEKTQFAVQPKDQAEKAAVVEGEPCRKSFRTDRQGNIYQLGDEHTEIMGAEMFVGDKAVFQPTAIEIWKETLHASEVLIKGKSEDGFMHEVATCNAIVSGLVTGYATYCRRRFLEIEWEGFEPDVKKLGKVAEPNSRTRKANVEATKQTAKSAGITLLQYWNEERNFINFQNFKTSERAFRRGYEIKFDQIGLSTDTIEKVKNYLNYRHRIQHISPLLTVYDRNSKPPVIASKKRAEEAISVFSDFVDALHRKTLELRPTKPK